MYQEIHPIKSKIMEILREIQVPYETIICKKTKQGVVCYIYLWGMSVQIHDYFFDLNLDWISDELKNTLLEEIRIKYTLSKLYEKEKRNGKTKKKFELSFAE